MSVEAEGANCRRLNEEWMKTVESVRSSVPGFEDFMLPKGVAKLQLAAEKGPVVVLNAGESRCHALILDSVRQVQCIALPGIITRSFVGELAQIIQALASQRTPSSALLAKLNERGHDFEATDRLLGRPVYEDGQSPEDWFCKVLRILWLEIVKPVLTLLRIQKSDAPPRLWWCPTGAFTFLPLHAAGMYGEQTVNESVDDYVISSYTPTVTALLVPPFPLFTADHPIKSTVVIQPDTPGHHSLPSTEEELRKIKTKIPEEWLTSFGSAGTRASLDAVWPHFQTSSILHFAGHGVQDTENPLESALLIGGERLTVSQIMIQSGGSNERRQNVEKHMALAFLSACETAMGDENLPDEAMHIAASLLFAGFNSVVATMWTMKDPDGPEVAEAFYGHLFRNADPASNPPIFPDLNESAEALHLAVRKLKTHVPFGRWVPFVHYGL
ncbi:CHAT domain-containing protein [Mycena galopus ATCC 62051]|nr:CHAT domain-containing protein [Mycena galopus ATCC 62051]